jgi:NAD(P)-dependent dehydrogenase (short-subunit alcohol dehydrogenase family)
VQATTKEKREMPGKLDGKVAIVTGSGAGMGRASAELMAQEGAKVVVAEWNGSAAVETRENIEAAGGDAAELVVDVSTAENAKAMVDFAVERYGGLDIMHNQVFAVHTGRIEDLTLEGWASVVQHCLSSTFLAMKFGLPVIRQAGSGSVINTASISGMVVHPEMGAYGAAKAGVISLTRYAAVEYGRYGVRVNSISPGDVESAAWLQQFGEASTATLLTSAPTDPPQGQRTASELEELRERRSRASLFGKPAKPSEIAEVVLFLASDSSSAITGTNIVVDGGSILNVGASDSMPAPPPVTDPQ